MIVKSPATNMRFLLTLIGSLCWLIVLSAELVETDAYRYAAAVLAIIAFGHYLATPRKPATNWLGWLCLGWGSYVIARFIITYFITSPHQVGASDWLYAFPLFFPMLGVALWLNERQFERIIAAFFAIALLVLLFTTRFQAIFNGETVKPLIMNNQIHASVACGLILLAACFWLLHYLSGSRRRTAYARFAFAVAPLIVILCFIAIYGGKSKGVWLALTLTLPVAALAALTYLRPRLGTMVVAVAAVVLVSGIYIVRHNLHKTAGPTFTAAVSMIEGIENGGDVGNVMVTTIDSTTTPVSMDERLQLWYNAGQLISTAPVFGWGNLWLEKWEHTRYPNVRYTLMHNGYLETLVRYGVFGAIVLSVILGAFLVSVWRAFKGGIIPRAAFHTYAICILFFSLTLLSNSNNRLAIGESLALFSSAFACWCNMRLTHAYDELLEYDAAADSK